MGMSLLKVNVYHIMKCVSKLFALSHSFGEGVILGTIVMLLSCELLLGAMGSNHGNNLSAHDKVMYI